MRKHFTLKDTGALHTTQANRCSSVCSEEMFRFILNRGMKGPLLIAKHQLPLPKHHQHIRVMIVPTLYELECKYGNEAVDFWAIPLLIKGRSSSARFLEMGEGTLKDGKRSRQDHGRNSSSFIPIVTH